MTENLSNKKQPRKKTAKKKAAKKRKPPRISPQPPDESISVTDMVVFTASELANFLDLMAIVDAMGREGQRTVVAALNRRYNSKGSKKGR